MKKSYLAGIAMVPVLLLSGCATERAYYNTTPRTTYLGPNVLYSTNYSTVGYGYGAYNYGLLGYGNYYNRGWQGYRSGWNGWGGRYRPANWGYRGAAFNVNRGYRAVGFQGFGARHANFRGGFHGRFR